MMELPMFTNICGQLYIWRYTYLLPAGALVVLANIYTSMAGGTEEVAFAGRPAELSGVYVWSMFIAALA